jgi:hypothetical protein
MRNTYQHENDLAPVRPFDCLKPFTRQFTGTPRVHRAYVLNRTTGQIIEACGHRHRTPCGASKCADKMLADRLEAISAGEK